MRFNDTAPARFAAKVDRRGPDECWPWTAGTNRDGYGQFRPGGSDTTSIAASRAAWVLEHGEDPGPDLVRHTCDNPPCVNPRHLVLGTPAQNSGDMVERGRQVRGEQHPNHGRTWGQPSAEERARGERHGRAQLTADDVRAIRRLALAGVPTADLAATFATSTKNVRAVVRRQAWAHVED